jgi:fluoride exporter
MAIIFSAKRHRIRARGPGGDRAMILWVAAGGALGASARHLLNIYVPRLLGGAFPWHTLVVNVLGCFIMGALIEAMTLRLIVSNEVRAFLTTGILGGFTTFSAFSLDFALLIQRGETAQAMGYAIGSVVLSLLAVFAGFWVVRGFA